MTDTQLLTVTEAAELLRVAPGTLYNWRAKGLGPKSVKVGACVRYKLADVLAALDDSADSETF